MLSAEHPRDLCFTYRGDEERVIRKENGEKDETRVENGIRAYGSEHICFDKTDTLSRVRGERLCLFAPTVLVEEETRYLLDIGK